MKKQETGLLFAELCVRQATPGGRIGIILPNGYLGNRSIKYLAFREWLLRQVKLVAVVGFPRFTFKKAGADVSASVVLMEKREVPLAKARDSERYPFYAALLESVGWSVGDKRAERIFKRREENGVILVNEANELLIDADFDRVLTDLYSSLVPSGFRWVTAGVNTKGLKGGWSVPIDAVFKRDDLSMDPKRWCQRVSVVREKIAALPHFFLGEVVDVIPQGKKPDKRSDIFHLVEIDNLADGGAMPVRCRGWQLPDRARHRAKTGDIFVGSIWSSVGKWFVAGKDCASMIVTNGMHRLRIKPGKENTMLDLLAGLNTEAYRIQARAFTTGSDGLADLPEESLKTIILPKISDSTARASLQIYLDALLEGRSTIEKAVGDLTENGKIPKIDVRARAHHVVLV